MKKISRLFLACFAFSIILLAKNPIVNASTEYDVTTEEELFQRLKEADTNLAGAPYIINIKNDISLDRRELTVFSNTTINAGTFKITSNVDDYNMIRVGSRENTGAKGYYYKNITINGGIWDKKGGSATAIKIGHAENFTMKDATVQNTKDAHLIEVAGVNGLTFDNCTFKKQIISKASGDLTYECIQLDIFSKAHFKGYAVEEDLAIKNVKVNNCKFSDAPRGIGSHTAVLNNPIDTIEITNCNFSNMKSTAIQLLNAKNITIKNNTITNSPRGIAILSSAYSKQDTYLSSTIDKASSISVQYIKPTDLNVLIDGNNITTTGNDPYASYEPGAIWVNGLNATKPFKTGRGDTIPKGNYYITGVTISNNTLSSHGFGVKLCDTRNTVVSDNAIAFNSKSPKNGYYGVTMREKSEKISVNGNTITGFLNGIYLKDAKASNITKNTITSPSKYGIGIDAKANVTNVKENKISKVPVNGIFVLKGKASNITGNTLENCGKYGIGVESSTVGKIEKNKITKSIKKSAINMWKSKVSEINGNTLKSKQNAINIDKSTIKKISKNTVTSTQTNGLVAGNGSKINSLQYNTFQKCKNGYAAVIRSDSKLKKQTSNKVKSCRSRIIVQK